jgi:hypothetical protein
MPRSAIAFGSTEQRSNALDGARLLNLYPETPPLGSRAPSLQITAAYAPLKSVLYGTPGLKSFATCGSGKIRAMRYALGYLWVLSDGSLYQVSPSGTATLCTGDTINPAGVAMMADNGKQVAILSGGDSYVVGQKEASFAFQVTGGSYNAGTNKLSSITVDSVTITSGDVDWTSSNSQLAADIAANINAFTSTPDYTATADNDRVIISAASGTGASGNGLAVSITVAGTVTVSKTAGTTSGGSDNGTTVAQITSDGYQTASSIEYLDGYAIWSAADSAEWFISSLYDASAIDALDFATASSTPSNLLRVFIDHREVWLFKPDTIEVWDDVGASPWPFQKNLSAVFERGCGAALSPAKIDNSVFWLGDDKIVYRSTGYQPQRISTHGIEDMLEKASDVSDAFGMTYTQEGHAFYVLTCPTLGRTFVYDCATQNWHERQSGTALIPGVWAVNCIVQAFGKLYAGTSGGLVGELDLDTYTEFSQPIRRAATTPPFYVDGKRFVVPDLEVEAELGVGLTSGQGRNPQILLRWSDDGGATWSNQRSLSLGLLGKRSNRPIFRRLGMARQREFELSVSDPVKVALYGLRFDAKALEA